MGSYKNIYQKLHVIQKTVKGLGKDKDGHGYKYVTGDKLLGEVKPLMNELGLLLKQEVISITNVRQDYTVGKDNRPKSEILSKVEMRFTWVDIDTGEKDENLFGANGQNDWDKGVGSAITYAERYFLLKYFHIATDEDDIDNVARKEGNTDAAPLPPEKPDLDEKHYKAIMARLSKGETGLYEKTMEVYRVSDIYAKAIKEAEEHNQEQLKNQQTTQKAA